MVIEPLTHVLCRTNQPRLWLSHTFLPFLACRAVFQHEVIAMIRYALRAQHGLQGWESPFVRLLSVHFWDKNALFVLAVGWTDEIVPISEHELYLALLVEGCIRLLVHQIGSQGLIHAQL